MKKMILVFLVMLISQASYGFEFSDKFKSLVDGAFKATTYQARISQLQLAITEGSDEEVFLIPPLIFPSNVLKKSKQDGLCKSEIDLFMLKFKAGLDTGYDQYMATNSEPYRLSLNQLIDCIHTAYK